MESVTNFPPFDSLTVAPVENPRFSNQEHAQKGYEATKERVSTYQKGQELLDKGGWKSMESIWSRWLDDWLVGCSVFFWKKGKIWVMKNEVANFGPSKGQQELLVNMDGLIGGPFFDGLIDGNGT